MARVTQLSTRCFLHVHTCYFNQFSPGPVLLDEALEADNAAMDPRVALPVFRLDCEQRPLDRLQHQQWLLLSGIAEDGEVSRVK